MRLVVGTILDDVDITNSWYELLQVLLTDHRSLSDCTRGRESCEFQKAGCRIWECARKKQQMGQRPLRYIEQTASHENNASDSRTEGLEMAPAKRGLLSGNRGSSATRSTLRFRAASRAIVD